MKHFFVLAVFCAGNGINEMMQLTFSPIFASTQAVFGVSAAAVTLLPTLFLLAFAPAALALAFLRTRWGLRRCLLAAGCVQALGAGLRAAACAAPSAPLAFPLLLAGQLLAALAQPVFTNLPAVLSTTWFAAPSRALATVAATLANPIGNALGSVVPGLVVPAVPAGASPAAAAAALARLTLAQALVALLVLAATWALVADAPAVPPSAAAALRRALQLPQPSPDSEAAAADSEAASAASELEGPSAALLSQPPPPLPPAPTRSLALLLRDYSALLRNGNFLRLLLGFAIGLGAFNALLALLGQLLAPCGYAPATAGLAGGAMLATGLLSSLGAGLALRASGAFVPSLRVGIVCACAGVAGFLAALRPGGSGALLAAAAALGAAAVPLLPLTLENAAEATFPVPEDASACLLTSAGKLAGVAFVAVLQPMAAAATCASPATPAAATIAAAMAVAALGLLTFRADYRRTASERSAEGAAAAAAAAAAASATAGAGAQHFRSV